VSDHDVQVVQKVFGNPDLNQEIDMTTVMGDDALWERNRDFFAPDAEVRFVIPPGGVEIMDHQEFVGIEGLREGWRIWMEAWEYFRVRLTELIDVGDGQVLLFGQAKVRTRSGGVELTQETAVLHRVEDDRIVSMAYYLDPDEARRDAGLV
jgi:ketosteroid isomerase-like protein